MPCSLGSFWRLWSRQVMGLQWRAGEATSGAAGRVEESLTKGLKAGIRVPGVQLHQCVRAGLEAFCRWEGRGWAGSWVGVGQWCLWPPWESCSVAWGSPGLIGDDCCWALEECLPLPSCFGGCRCPVSVSRVKGRRPVRLKGSGSRCKYVRYSQLTFLMMCWVQF